MQPKLAAGGKLELVGLEDWDQTRTGNAIAVYARRWDGTRFVKT